MAAGAVSLVVALGVAFVLGRWSAESASPASPAPRAQAAWAPSAPATLPRTEWPRAPHEPAGSPVPEPGPAPASAPATVTPDLLERVTGETKSQIEALRVHIVSRCWHPPSQPGDATSTSLTLSLAFDAEGREIARGITEDRRAPAPEFARCLRNLDGMTLSVTPPGTAVGVTVPVTFP